MANTPLKNLRTNKELYEKNPPKLDLSGIKLYKKQKEIFEDNHRFKIVVFGRQSGKSFLARYIILHKAINERKNCMWVSKTVGSARSHWLAIINLISKAGFPIKDVKMATKEIYFYGGGSIIVRSAHVPDNLRGETMGFIVTDEFAFYPNNEMIWHEILTPMVTASRGEILVISTPVAQDFFYDLYLRGVKEDKYFASWQMTSTESPYQDKELLMELRKNIPPIVWETEYMAQFPAQGAGIFTGLERVATLEGFQEPIDGHRYSMGIDWGSTNDFTAVVLFDMDSREMVWGERFTSIGTLPQIERIIELIKHWQPERVYAELNGLGTHMVGLLKEKLLGVKVIGYDDITTSDSFIFNYTDTRITAIQLTADIKRRMVERYAADIEFNRCKLPVRTYNDFTRAMFAEMGDFVRITQATGLAYKADKNGHDDTVMASCYAYMGVPELAKIRPVKEKSDTVKLNPFRNSSRGKLKNANG